MVSCTLDRFNQRIIAASISTPTRVRFPRRRVSTAVAGGLLVAVAAYLWQDIAADPGLAQPPAAIAPGSAAAIPEASRPTPQPEAQVEAPVVAQPPLMVNEIALPPLPPAPDLASIRIAPVVAERSSDKAKTPMDAKRSTPATVAKPAVPMGPCATILSKRNSFSTSELGVRTLLANKIVFETGGRNCSIQVDTKLGEEKVIRIDAELLQIKTDRRTIQLVDK